MRGSVEGVNSTMEGNEAAISNGNNALT